MDKTDDWWQMMIPRPETWKKSPSQSSGFRSPFECKPLSRGRDGSPSRPFEKGDSYGGSVNGGLGEPALPCQPNTPGN